jgi:hypothetical protein
MYQSLQEKTEARGEPSADPVWNDGIASRPVVERQASGTVFLAQIIKEARHETTHASAFGHGT